MRKTLLHCSILLASATLIGCGPGDESYNTVAKDPDMLSSADIEQNVTATDGTEHARRYLYLRTIRKAPRYFASLGSNSWFNDTKLVTLHRSENGIDVLEEDKGAIGAGQEYSPFDNAENLRPLLTINGDYVDFKCSTDSYDKCTNQEQENNDADVKWFQKKYFVPDLDNLTVKDVGFNDIDMNRCLSKSGSPRIVRRTETTENGQTVTWNGQELDLKNGVINLEIAQDYTASLSAGCEDFSPQDTINNYSLTVTSFVSIVALDAQRKDDSSPASTLVSKNYKPIPYAEQESTTFGFFKTTIEHLDTFNDGTSDSQFRQYLDRWNPEKPVLHYYLSNNFYEAKNAPYLAAATQGVALINAENEVFKTGVPHIQLAAAGNRQSGDLRYAIIELADEPLANGLLGYAPIATNPLTGEIVSGVVNQYSGNAINVVPYYWQELRRSFTGGKFSLKQLNLQVNHPAKYTAASHHISLSQAKSLIYPVTPNADDSYLVGNKLTHLGKLLSGGFDVLSTSQINDLAQHKTSNSIYEDVADGQDVSLPRLAQQKQEELYNLGRNNMLSTQALEHTAFSHGDYRTLPKGVRELPGQTANLYRIDWSKDSYYTDGTHTKLKNFKDLTVADQQDLKVKLSAAIFASTLTHEMGHSLGLRHNFMGSLDAQNYNFSDKDMATLKRKLADNGFPNIEPHSNSSSRMEYSLDAYSTGYGPYDMAALRFGYARQVALSSDALGNLAKGQHTLLKDIPITSDQYASLTKRDDERRAEIADLEGRGEGLGQYSRGVANSELLSQIKTFKFCTDDNTFLTHTCNRFDAGFTASQITHNMIDSYNTDYLQSNTRNDRDNFGIGYMTYYTITRMNIFSALHAFIEDSHDLLADGESGLQVSSQKIINNVVQECKTQDPETGAYDEADIPTLMSIYQSVEISSIVCDMVDATNNGRQFLLDTALAPLGRRLTTHYIDSRNDGLYSFDLPLNTVKDEYVKKNGPLNLKPGEVLLDSDSHPALLRDMAEYAVGQMTNNNGKLLTKDATMADGTIIKPGVELTGHPLNSMLADTSDPNHPYVNDRDVLGVWPDKLLAVRTLLTRSHSHLTTSSTTASLVDSSFTGEILKLGICRQALGDVYVTAAGDTSVSSCLPVLSNDIYSSGIVDQDAVNAVVSGYQAQNVVYNSFSDWATTNIETVPGFAYAVASYFNLPITGNISMLRAMLNQFVLGSSTENTGVQLRSASKAYREFASVYNADSTYSYQSPIVVDFNNLTGAAAMQTNLADLIAHKATAKSMIVRTMGANEDFVVKENNRLALVLIQAYIKTIVDSSKATDPTAAAAISANTARLNTILQTMPRTDRNAELDDASLLASY